MFLLETKPEIALLYCLSCSRPPKAAVFMIFIKSTILKSRSKTDGYDPMKPLSCNFMVIAVNFMTWLILLGTKGLKRKLISA